MIILAGKIASGKTTLAKELERRHGFHRVRTYTTRPPRDGEQDGVDYHFITTEEFEKKIQEGFFAEFVQVDASFGQVYYGSPRPEYADPDALIVLDPNGVRRVKDLGAFTVFLDVPEKELRRRLEKRGDDPEEIESRLKREETTFADMPLYCTKRFVPEEGGSIKELAERIWKEYENYKRRKQ